VVTGSNLSVGGNWLAKNTADNNTAVGCQTLTASNAGNNTAVGCQALTSSTTSYLNTGVGTYSMYYLTKVVNNTAVGFISGETISTGTENVCLGSAAGYSITIGTRNVFIGSNCEPYGAACTGAICIGSRVNESAAHVMNTSGYQLYIAPTITSFNISGLAASTGTGAGTILEFDSAGNILPTAGTYKTILAIDTIIAAIDAPYAMSYCNK